LLWFDHPRYVRAREELVERVRSEKYRFRRKGPCIFLCGGSGSVRRERMRAYLLRHVPELLGVFYAERVWEHITAHESQMTALQMEAQLAKLADMVVVIVESPGTFAELGAFSLSDDLRVKMLAIVDSKHSSDESFILTGPVRWIDRDSTFGPTIFVPFETILDCVGEVEDRINRIPRPRSAKVADLSTSRKHLLFFLCDLVAVTYPATIGMLQHYVDKIVGPGIEIETLVGLAQAMDLLRSHTVDLHGISFRFYAPESSSALALPYHHRRLLDLQTQRANHVSVLLTIPDAVRVLDVFAKGDAGK
jgi:hypothetical protein